MSVARRATALRWVLLPFLLLHELFHVLASVPWAESWHVTISSESDAAAYVEWADDAPAWGVALAHLAPMVSGAIIACTTGIVLLLNGLSTVQPSGLGLLMWVAFGLGLIALTWPSPADINGARTALDGGDDS